MGKDPTIDSKERWRNLRMYKKRNFKKDNENGPNLNTVQPKTLEELTEI